MSEISIEIVDFDNQEVKGDINTVLEIVDLFNHLTPLKRVVFWKIKFSEEIFKEILFFNEYYFEFYECELDLLLDLSFTGNKICFTRCVFGDVVFVKNSKNSELEFRSQVLDSIYFSDSFNIKVEIISCKVDIVSIEKIECPEFVFSGDLEVQEVSISDSNIDNFFMYSVRINILEIDRSNIKFIRIVNCVGNELILLDDYDRKTSELDDIHILDSNYKIIRINGNGTSKSFLNKVLISNTSNFEISNVHLDKLGLVDGVFSNIRIVSVSVNDFNIVNSYIKENIELVFVSVYNVFSTSGSNLFGLFITTPFFHIPRYLIFEDSYFKGMRIGDFIDFKKGKITNSENMSELDKINFFRQFSLLLNENNHHFLSKKYRSIQYNLQLKYFKSDGITDWFILLLNMLTNNHGINPRRPIMVFLMLIFSFAYMLFYFHSIPDISYASFFTSNLSFLLNPIFDDNEIENLIITKSYPVYKFGYKVIYSYVVYQFVAAFRVFNK
ncbi:hypothetical protein [Algoriphagus aquimarinus]|mgnify:CR=1 FL=1|uniref:hypothetical protein n=1 Tax=Algoriphagus aquimarinus TaxID=237018 RepID=UPI0030DD240A|tara:strand:+ start:26973 stop:28466 length:1494 start_codon:yes stop_codon:yes gene_type:complete